MKKILLTVSATAILGLLICLYACHKSDLQTLHQTSPVSTVNLAPSLVTNPFKSTVGAPIAVSTGNQWINNFKKANNGETHDYIIEVKDLQNILRNSDCVGVCLYFAKDENQSAYVLPIGVDMNGRLIHSNQINTPRGMISWDKAQQWIANDLDPIDARFFGRNTFGRLFKDPKCLQIRAIEALDDQQKPQLLLSNAAINYQLASSSNLKYEDLSTVCPPLCPIVQ